MPLAAHEMAVPPNVFVARQPIFETEMELHGYELLFRSDFDNRYSGLDGDKSTAEVIVASLIDIGLDELAGNTRVFINFTANLLKGDAASVLPPERVVIEVLEDVRPEPEVIEACRRLKRLGYTIALDDFVDGPNTAPLIQFADIIKVDVQCVPTELVRRWLHDPRLSRAVFLAEKVETVAEYEKALDIGFTLFQGYFFSRPRVMSARSLKPSELACLDALRESAEPELDFDRLATVVKRDVSLTYNLLRLINCAALGIRSRIAGIHQALVLLGEKDTQRWLALMSLRCLCQESPTEAMVVSVVRGRMGELLAVEAGIQNRPADVFFLGVFSLIDALLGRPMEDVLDQLPLAADVRGALLGEPNRLGSLLELIIAYERGDWDTVGIAARSLGVNEAVISGHYIQAIKWAREYVPQASRPKHSVTTRLARRQRSQWSEPATASG